MDNLNVKQIAARAAGVYCVGVGLKNEFPLPKIGVTVGVAEFGPGLIGAYVPEAVPEGLRPMAARAASIFGGLYAYGRKMPSVPDLIVGVGGVELGDVAAKAFL